MPQRRPGRFGACSRTGSHVKWPALRASVAAPFDSRPSQGWPSAYEWRVSAPAAGRDAPPASDERLPRRRAAPAGDRGRTARTGREVRYRLDSAAPGRAEEHPLVGVGPGEGEPAAVWRPVSRRTSRAGEQLAAVGAVTKTRLSRGLHEEYANSWVRGRKGRRRRTSRGARTVRTAFRRPPKTRMRLSLHEQRAGAPSLAPSSERTSGRTSRPTTARNRSSASYGRAVRLARAT